MITRRTVLAAATLATGAVTLLAAGCASHPAVATPAPSTPASAPATTPSVSPPGAAVSSAPPAQGSVYYTDGDKVLRGRTTVLSAGGYTANVSPNGASIAFVDANNNVVVTDANGQHKHTVFSGSVGVGYEPAWSPDSRRLLVSKSDGTLGTVTVSSGSFTPLAHPLKDAIHPLWSADGKHLGYATGTCQIGTADADGGNAHLVPGYGNRDRRSCDPYSISPDGHSISVNQRTGDEPDGDIGRDLTANALIDTRTGATVSLPVSGTITAILFQPNGEILVRTNNHQLTLLNPDRTIKTHITESAGSNTRLLAYNP
jgi:TolB protein